MTTALKWLTVVALVAVGVYYGLYTPGQAVFVYGEWSMEMPLALFAVLAVLSFIALHWLLQLTTFLRFLPRRWRQRRERRAQGSFEAALIAIAGGDWDEAEQAVLRYSRHASAPYMHHLLAAFAAHVQGIYVRRDDHLAQARGDLDNEELPTVLFAAARLRIDAQQWSEARATLEELHGLVPRNAALLRMLAGVCERQSDWTRVGVLLPEIERHKALNAQEFVGLQAKFHAAKVSVAKDETELDTAWQAVPAGLRTQPPVAGAYAQQCITRGDGDAAEEVLRRAIDHQWSGPLVAMYGKAFSTNTAKQLNHAEDWLRTHGDDPALIITLAQLCVHLKLWDQAQFHLDRSLGLAPSAEAYVLLMQLYRQQGDIEKLLTMSRDALAAWDKSVGAAAVTEPPAIAL